MLTPRAPGLTARESGCCHGKSIATSFPRSHINRFVICIRSPLSVSPRTVKRRVTHDDAAAPPGTVSFDSFWRRHVPTEPPATEADVPLPPPRPPPEDSDLEARLRAMGMGSWRLRSRTPLALSVALAQVEQSWRDQIEDLTLVSLPSFARLVDSCDPARKTAYSHAEVPDPARDAPRYPRVLAEARAYKSGLFARLLIWLVLVQDGSQILHVHMLPSGARDLGVVSLDLVADPSGHLSAATVDVCPVGWPRRLPGAYSQALQELQRQWALPKPARAPEWAAKTGSHLCYHARGLDRDEDVGAVIKYAVALVRYQVQVARLVTALAAGDARRRAVLEAQRSFYQTRLQSGDGLEAVKGCLARQEMQEYSDALFPASAIV